MGGGVGARTYSAAAAAAEALAAAGELAAEGPAAGEPAGPDPVAEIGYPFWWFVCEVGFP